MRGSSFFRGSQPVLNALAVCALIVSVMLGYGVNAASTSGTASATVLSQISSQPVSIVSPAPGPAPVQQASQPVSLSLPIRLSFSIDQPSRSAGGIASRTGEGSSFGITMIDVDASGVARFSVAGAGSTSGYIVQFPASADSLLRQFPSAASTCDADAASNAAQGCKDASLIVPAQALEGGGRLAVEISQALSKLIAGELSVQVNYN
ncbi:hypothetical protein [Polaromonas sp.]|uniref:hypothetical protein n=1 Tax=Polaromonas sp. TaxID=1869339 RepID=UPI003266F71E